MEIVVIVGSGRPKQSASYYKCTNCNYVVRLNHCNVCNGWNQWSVEDRNHGCSATAICTTCGGTR